MATEILRPNGAGSETALDWEFPTSAAHYTLVDDVTPDHGIGTTDAPDKAGSTCVQNKDGATGVYQRDLYALPASSGSGAINQIEVFLVTLHNASNAQASIRTGGTTWDSANLAIAATWKEVSKVWSFNPTTNNAWLWADIDALEIGLRLSGSTASPDWSACTQVYVVISYGWSGGDILGVDIGTVAKINGIALGNITKVNGIA